MLQNLRAVSCFLFRLFSVLQRWNCIHSMLVASTNFDSSVIRNPISLLLLCYATLVSRLFFLKMPSPQLSSATVGNDDGYTIFASSSSQQRLNPPDNGTRSSRSPAYLCDIYTIRNQFNRRIATRSARGVVHSVNPAAQSFSGADPQAKGVNKRHGGGAQRPPSGGWGQACC